MPPHGVSEISHVIAGHRLWVATDTLTLYFQTEAFFGYQLIWLCAFKYFSEPKKLLRARFKSKFIRVIYREKTFSTKWWMYVRFKISLLDYFEYLNFLIYIT